MLTPKIKGSGDYNIKSKGGFGGTIGSWIGDAAQRLIEHLTGSGAYTVKSNSIIHGQGLSSGGPPVFSTNGRTNIIVCRREFVRNIASSGSAFNITSFILNPTSGLFPWLADVATNFELYRFHGIVFEFKATTGMAISSSNAAMGSVILATRYNALSSQFTSQQQMEEYEYSTSTAGYVSALHPVECAPFENALSELYTDPGYASGDPRMSLMGVFDVATIGQQAASTLGELWVTYHVELIRPRMFGVIPSTGFTSRLSASNASTALVMTDLLRDLLAAQLANSEIYSNNGDPSTTEYLPGTPVSQSLELRLGSSSAGTSLATNSFSFPIGVSGFFLVEFIVNTSGSSVTVAVPGSNAVTVSNGASLNTSTLVGYNLTGGVGVFPANGATSVSQVLLTFGIRVQPYTASGSGTGAAPTVTFAGSGFTLPSATTVQTYLNVLQLSS